MCDQESANPASSSWQEPQLHFLYTSPTFGNSQVLYKTGCLCISYHGWFFFPCWIRSYESINWTICKIVWILGCYRTAAKSMRKSHPIALNQLWLVTIAVWLMGNITLHEGKHDPVQWQTKFYLAEIQAFRNIRREWHGAAHQQHCVSDGRSSTVSVPADLAEKQSRA